MIVICNTHTPHDGLDNRPGSFAGLMDLYERNYINIRRLAPRLPPPGSSRLSQAPRSLDLHLHVIERFRYTTELCLTYHFQRTDGLLAEPDLQIRVYHDARQAEVMSARLRHRPQFHSIEDETGTLHARWHVNRFLYKWLNYCLYQGHCFARSDRRNLD